MAAANKSVTVPTLNFGEREVHIVDVTPDVAAEFLTFNEANRDISLSNLGKIVLDMESGDYLFTGEAIKFSEDGVLLDGQHRLTALIQTGLTFPLVVTTGVQLDAQARMDSGKGRTLRDTLKIRDEKQPGVLAAVINGIQVWARGDRAQDGTNSLNTKSSALAFYAANPGLRELAPEAHTLAALIPGLSTRQVAQLIWAFDERDANDRKDFFAKLVSGAGLEAGNPILTLRNFLARDKTATRKHTAYYRMAVTAKAWNAYRAGELMHAVKFTAGGSKPEAFPEPV